MTLRQQWSVVGVIVLVLGGGLFAATRFMGGQLFPVSVGSHAPSFQASVLGHPQQTRTLDDYRGQVVLLDIWASWCVPCRQEAPTLEKLYQEFGPKGLRIVSVSVDAGPGADQKVRDFAKEFGLTFPLLHDGTGTIQHIYQTTGVPENFVIDRQGIIRKKVYAEDWTSPGNQALIRQLLSERSN
ncbi:MAG TPA: TlpA disulfide reductase family protein [Gemmatimonadaceae bacterium]|nr:TlpA disulfide reductase family protein [Gemmatimonadaceae bacterium]